MGTYNCEGFLAGAHYIADRLLPACDVLFLAETWLSRAEESHMPHVIASLMPGDYQCLQEFAMDLPPRAGEGRPHGGVALVCRRQAGRSFRAIDCGDPRLCGVMVLEQTRPAITVLCCYMPYWESSGANLEEYTTLTCKLDALILSLKPSAPVLLVGDFNCALPPLSHELRPPGWHRLRGFSPMSLHMQNLLDDHELTVAELRFPQPVDYTYARAGGKSHIDHIAVPSCLLSHVHECSIVPPSVDNLSPHLPIICGVLLPSVQPAATVFVRPVNKATVSSEVLDWSCPDKLSEYASSLNKLLDDCLCAHDASPDASPDELDAIITHCIHTAARSAGCSKPRRPAKSWWSPTVAAARDRTRFWHQLWVSCDRPTSSAVSQCYETARSAYRRARRRAAVSQIESEANALRLLRRDKHLTTFWRRVQRIRRGGVKPASECGTADFRNHFQTVHLDCSSQLSRGQLEITELVETRLRETHGDACNMTITAGQVAGLICRLHRGKAPGIDGITAEHLLHGQSTALLEALARLLSACMSTCSVPATFADSVVVPLLKKTQLDPNCLDNYRPITITTCASKLLEFVILDELNDSFVPHPLQFGFISHRGTEQASLLAGETRYSIVEAEISLYFPLILTQRNVSIVYGTTVYFSGSSIISASTVGVSWSAGIVGYLPE